jgi:glycosyltransferase involved in cell wall biosynthesis
MPDDYKISVVIPCYNEEGNIQLIYSEIVSQLKKYKNYELIFIDDGCTDATLSMVKEICSQNPSIKYISLSRNFGHQNALKAGLDFATGNCVISMDGDMQHPPEMIDILVSKWHEGFDVVYTIRKEDNKLPFFKRLTSKYFYKFINYLSDYEIKNGAADFRLLDRKVVNVIKNLPENFLFFRGLVSWVGFKQAEVHFTPNVRHSGETKYSMKKMVHFASTGITSFSVKPLKLSIFIGVIIALLAFIYALFVIWASLFTDKVIQGWTSVILSVLFIGGIQLIMIGIIGEYLGKLFLENKKRPNYIVSENNF